MVNPLPWSVNAALVAPPPSDSPGNSAVVNNPFVEISQSQREFLPVCNDWELIYARVVLRNNDVDAFVKTYEHGGFCEVSYNSLVTKNQDIFYKMMVPNQGWVHDRPFVPDWMRYPKKRVLTRISYDMYNTDPTALTAVPRPLGSIPEAMSDARVMELMAPILEYFCDVLKIDEQREYLLDWYANQVQHPSCEMKSQVGIIFSGEQGVGKNTYLDFWRVCVLGEALASKISMKRLFGNHTVSQKLKVLVQVDEIEPDMCTLNREDLKDVMTAPTVLVNEKYLKEKEWPNFCNLVMTTNHDDTVHIPASDRRWVIFDFVNDKAKADDMYWVRLRAHLARPEVAAAAYQYFFRMRDISHRIGRWAKDRPYSPSYIMQQQSDLEPIWGFLSMHCYPYVQEAEHRAHLDADAWRAEEARIRRQRDEQFKVRTEGLEGDALAEAERVNEWQVNLELEGVRGAFVPPSNRMPPHAPTKLSFVASEFGKMFHFWMERVMMEEAEKRRKWTTKLIGMRFKKLTEACSEGARKVEKKTHMEYELDLPVLAEYLKRTNHWDSLSCTHRLHRDDMEPDYEVDVQPAEKRRRRG